jgi:hypothetical protein
MSRKLFCLVLLLLAVAKAGYAGQANNSQTPTLEKVRELVARNEELLNPVKVSYTAKVIRINDRPTLATGGRKPSGRKFSHYNVVWAQSGQNQYVKIESFYGPNEPAGSSVEVFDEQVVTEAKLPDMMEGYIQVKDRYNSCWYHVLTTKLGLRPFGGQYNLSEVLVPGLATIHNELKSIGNRHAYVIDVQKPDFSSYFSRVWIDSERGIPLLLRSYNQHPERDPNGFSSELKSTSFYQLPNRGWIPTVGTRSLYNRRSDPVRITHENLIADVNSITTKLEDIPESLFTIEFPDGARIYNSISGLTTVKGQSLKTYEQIINAGSKYIAGVIVDEKGTPVPDVVVCPFNVRTIQNNGRFRHRLIQVHDRPCAITDKKGYFAIELEEEGLYALLFFPNDFADLVVRDVPLGKHDLKVTLSKGGTVKGRVVRLANEQKIPVANVNVFVEQGFGTPFVSHRSSRLSAKTDKQGRFQIRYLTTRIPKRRSGNQQKQEYVPASWSIRCGKASKSILFKDETGTKDVELILKPDVREAPPLIDRKLPEFKDIKIDFNRERAKGKMILVCFVDMWQRPSRNCIRQLSKKADELKEKGIVVAVIQASKDAEFSLDSWIEKNNVPFPAGMIEGEVEQTRINWGVKSLPWFVLTDTEYVVTAEGFSLGELNEKLGQIGDTK